MTQSADPTHYIPESRYPDVMVDLETTGTRPETTAIIQIAAVKFNLKTGEVCPEFFDQCLLIPPTRFWAEDTREWWISHRDVLKGIMGRMREPKVVMEEFSSWVKKDNQGDRPVMWAKPSSFEFPFLQSYFNQFEVGNPFHFRYVNDLNSFIRSRYYPEAPPEWEKDLPFDGPPHNALFDVLHQIKTLFAAYNDTKEKACSSNLVIPA